MRAVRTTGGAVHVVEVPEPEGDGVLLDVRSVGICGTDLHLLAGAGSPVTPGHEVGAMLDGRPVALQPFAFCGTCESCERGQHHLCVNGRTHLYGIHVDGGMADRLVVDPSCVVELPHGLAADAAVLVEPLAVGVHAVDRVELEAGMRVAVVGAGTIGQVTAAAARAAGAEVDIAARHAPQQACSERLGLRVGLGKGYDVVFDAAGTDASLAVAVGAVRAGGTVVVPAVYWDDARLPGLAFSLKEVRLLPSMYYGRCRGGRDIDEAAALLGRLPDLPDALITHRFPLERAAEAFATAADRAAGAIKVVVDIDS